MSVARTTHHVEEEELKKEFRETFIKSVLIGTSKDTCLLSKISTVPEALKKIFQFATPTLKESDFYYKLGLTMCSGTEHVFVESLEVEAGDKRRASLISTPIGSSQFYITKSFLRNYAWLTNEDGSYLNEGQLRRLWRVFAVSRACSTLTAMGKRCNGVCCALPGDTIFFRYNDYDYPESYKYEPASQEDIIERGFYAPGRGGLLSAQARIAREDLSQVAPGPDSEDED